MNKILLILIMCLQIVCSFGQTIFADRFNNEIIITKKCITISYNPTYKIPNYVGEKLTAHMITGNVQRETKFHAETILPYTLRTFSSQYTNTGYDRGHMAPAADFQFNKIAMYESFSMANVAPQLPELNRNQWKILEEYVRKQTANVDTLYIITGTIVDKKPQYISKTIVVPSAFYKAIYGVKGKKIVIKKAWIYQNNSNLTYQELTISKLQTKIKHKLFIGIK